MIIKVTEIHVVEVQRKPPTYKWRIPNIERERDTHTHTHRERQTETHEVLETHHDYNAICIRLIYGSDGYRALPISSITFQYHERRK